TGMVELVAQFLLVDLVGELDGGGAVDERERGVDIAVEAPDHLKHQQLVEVGVEQAADDRVELPRVVVHPAGYVCLRHVWPPLILAQRNASRSPSQWQRPDRCRLRRRVLFAHTAGFFKCKTTARRAHSVSQSSENRIPLFVSML